LIVGTFLLAGCGQAELVPVAGTVLLEGVPAASGRLMLTPLGGSDSKGPVRPRAAASLVGAQGEFVLRTDGADPGAVPGAYRALFRQDVSPEEAPRSPRAAAGRPALEELTVMYRSAPANPIVIGPEGNMELVIDIRERDGWTRVLSE
jgi:hypothetical protein